MSDISVIKWQDLALEDSAVRDQFIQYFRNGNYTQAIALINSNPNIDSKTVLPQVFNMMNTALVYLQNLYYNSVEVVLSNDQQQFQNMINNYLIRGEYDPEEIYVPYHFVTYNQQVYMCIKETTAGTLPTDNEYWLLIGLKGADGADSIDVTLKYMWSPSTSYSEKDIVSYNNVLYVALRANGNMQPDISPDDWEVFLYIPRAKIIVSATEPDSSILDFNGQWWQIIN